jgi:hypothetical protein
MCMTEKFWEALVTVLGDESLRADPRFVDGHRRHRHRKELTEILDPVFRRGTTEQWLDKLAGVLPVGPVNDAASALTSPFTTASGMVQTVPHPHKADLRLLGNPIKVNGVRADLTVCPPLGADNEVLPQRTGLLLRFGERSEEQGSAKPARFAHLDYTTPSAYRFVELVTEWEHAELAPYRRFASYQTWRATSPPPQDNTLAICDGRTVANDDTMEFDVTIGHEAVPGNTFVSRVCKANDAHRWFYFSNLTRDELLIFKAFDSAAPDANNAAHTAFDDPTAPRDAVPRASVEAGLFAFFE